MMENSNWVNYKIGVREKLKGFALDILLLSAKIPTTTSGKVLNYQITKLGTSTYANYRAALRGRSKAEFFSEPSIAVEEADESEMWLELLISSRIMSGDFTEKLYSERKEIIKSLASMRKRLQ